MAADRCVTVGVSSTNCQTAGSQLINGPALQAGPGQLTAVARAGSIQLVTSWLARDQFPGVEGENCSPIRGPEGFQTEGFESKQKKTNKKLKD